ncbi:MAG: molybdopterin-dependent oxidoreductase, partial [Alphaproteobacteria bacterium]
LLRTAPKGSADPGFTPISWSEALDIATRRIRELAAADGRQAIAFAVTTPSGTAIADSFAWIHRLAHAFGSPNLVFATENCNWHKDFSPMLTWGAGIGMPDFDRTGLILLWGFNPTATWLSQVERIKAAQRRGAKVVAIDPRRQGLARSANLWLGVRPGTDGALALGLCHLLIERGGADMGFLRQYTDAAFLVRQDDGALLKAADVCGPGYDDAPVIWDEIRGGPVPYDRATRLPADAGARPALVGRFDLPAGASIVSASTVFDRLRDQCAAFPPERVQSLTGVPADQIIQLADWLASSGPASFFTWTGTAQHAGATQMARAIHVLYALTGCLDAPGGNVWFARPLLEDVARFDWVTPETRALTLGLGERPLGPPQRGWITTRDLSRAIATEVPYPVRALVSFGGDFALTKPKTAHAQEALRKLDFFLMTELFLTPSCQEADLIFPAASCWEREGLQPGFMVDAAAEAWIQLRPAVVPAVGESRSDTAIVFELARRLGLADRFFGGDPEPGLAAMLKPTGLSPTDLRREPRGLRQALPDAIGARRQNGFATDSGRVELFAASLATVGEDPIPTYRPPPEPVPGGDYPLRLTCAKWPQFRHSQERQSASIRAAMPHPLVQIHPSNAAARGIADGDRITVHTPTGSFTGRAELSSAVLPEVVCAQYGWWDAEAPFTDPGLSFNAAIDGEDFDAVSGSNALRSAVCNIDGHGSP